MAEHKNWWEDGDQVRRLQRRFEAVHLDRRQFLRVAGAAAGAGAMSAIVAACGGGEEAGETPAGGGTTGGPTPQSPAEASPASEADLADEQLFRTNLERDPQHFDFNKDLYADADAAVFAQLGKFTPDMEAVPDIAESWEPNDDSTVWTFKIRTDSKWSNGDLVTAHDYEWSWKRQLDPETAATYAAFLYDIKNAESFNTGGGATRDDVGVKALDDTTLEVTMEDPAGYFPIIASYIAAAPAHRASVEQYGDQWTEPQNIVCNGPFKLVQWDHDQLIVLEKNDQYWDADSITLQRVERPIIASDASQLAYENNEIDWHYRGQLGQFERVQGDPTLSAEMVKYNTFGTWYLVPDPNMPPFDVKEVRLAMAHAIDRDVLANQVLKGLGTPAYTFAPPGMPGYVEDTFPDYTAYDPEKAMSLLQGTPYEGGTNWPKITLTQREEGDAPAAVGDAIIQMLKQNLGMQIEHEIGEPKETYDRMYKHEIQLMWVRWFIDYPDQNNVLFQVWYSKTPTGRRHAWANDEFDQLVSEAGSLSDPDERLQKYTEAQRIQIEDGAAIYVYNPWNYGLMKPWVTNLPRDKDGNFTPRWNVFTRDYDYYKILKH